MQEGFDGVARPCGTHMGDEGGGTGAASGIGRLDGSHAVHEVADGGRLLREGVGAD